MSHPVTLPNPIVRPIEKVLYTAKVQATGGRDRGTACSSDSRLDIALSVPGLPGSGTNPEQLLAAGWSASFLSSLKLVAAQMKVPLRYDPAIDTEIDLCTKGGGNFLQARLSVSLPGIHRELAEAIVDGAHEMCPFSRATRGHINVTLSVS
jgi:lipoyl-dependent peroxiredoxin